MENIFLLKQRLNRHRLVVFVIPIIDLNGLKCNTFSSPENIMLEIDRHLVISPPYFLSKYCIDSVANT